MLGWKRAERYFTLSFGHTWPTSAREMVCYLKCVGATVNGRSALGRAIQALSFMERAGGVPLPQQISKDPAIKAAYQELSLVCAGGVTRPTKKAPQIPLYFMACFEDMVICEAQPLYWRLFSWYRLVRFWRTMRFDDHRGNGS